LERLNAEPVTREELWGRNFLCVSDFSKTIEYYPQHLAIAKEVGDRAGEKRTRRLLPLWFDAGQEDAALAHLKEHLSWRVQRGRDTCAGVGKRRARTRRCSRAAAAV
jgi:hypothetical protein